MTLAHARIDEVRERRAGKRFTIVNEIEKRRLATSTKIRIGKMAKTNTESAAARKKGAQEGMGMLDSTST